MTRSARRADRRDPAPLERRARGGWPRAERLPRPSYTNVVPLRRRNAMVGAVQLPEIGMTRLMQRLALIAIGAMALSASASAAGIDSRTVTCANLQTLIAAQGFVFISQPFGDFVVAGANFCGGGQLVQLRSVPTVDGPNCPVNYCVGNDRFN